MSKFVFFWGGPFSQWAYSPFEINGRRFVTAEQWMMWNKAMMFGDTEIADKILATDDPREQKKLGRKVQGFDDKIWMEMAYQFVVQGNRAKFTQNEKFRDALKTTIGKVLVEASPYDKRWGIGLAETAPGINDPANWKGENLLGEAITEVRIEMFGE